MHREHHADRDARRNDEGRGTVPELVRMPEDFARFIGRASRFDDGLRAKRRDRAGQFTDAERAGANAVDN